MLRALPPAGALRRALEDDCWAPSLRDDRHHPYSVGRVRVVEAVARLDASADANLVRRAQSWLSLHDRRRHSPMDPSDPLRFSRFLDNEAREDDDDASGDEEEDDDEEEEEGEAMDEDEDEDEDDDATELDDSLDGFIVPDDAVIEEEGEETSSSSSSSSASSSSDAESPPRPALFEPDELAALGLEP